MKQMKRLTTKEEEIMRIFWEHGPMFVRELLSFYRITILFLPLCGGWKRRAL